MKRNRLMTLTFGALTALAFVFGTVSQVQATTYYLNINSPVEIPPYTNDWNEGAHTIEQILPYVQDGDHITVMPGTYPLTSPIVITKNLQIHNFYMQDPEQVIFDGQDLTTCFNLSDTDTVLTALTIRNAKTAGIRCTGSSPLVYDCIIEDTTGSGMVMGQTEYTIFRNNTGASNGGGASGTIATRSTFMNNSVSSRGGGLHNGIATNCLFIGNAAGGNGGGLYSSTAVCCAITGNSTTGDGGGLYSSTATHCTITENTANNGGGMAYGNAYNSILWNNSASIYATQVYSCCLPDSTANGSITNDPQLISFSHISATSPCIDAANPDYAPRTDIDVDLFGTLPAIGCDEVDSINGEINFYNDLPEQVSVGQPVSFTAYTEGPLTLSILNFGDGTPAITNSTGFTYLHTWAEGDYDIVLTGYNALYPDGISFTNKIFVRTDFTTTIYVSDADGDDDNDGESWATAKKTIQAGIDAQDCLGGLILVSNGTYSVTSEIKINRELRLQSLSGADQTTIVGDNRHRTLNLGDRLCRVEGFTLRNGGDYAAAGILGGTIYSTSHDPVVADCVITENTSTGKGAMWRGTATNCVFSSNGTSGNGPGAMMDGIAIDCRFEQNESTGGSAHGGAMYGGVATRCLFKNNTNTSPGGAMVNGQAYDCQFIGNSSENNGGAAQNSAVYNCVFNGNKANEYGGGMSYGSATHCTFTANRASTGGGTYNTSLDHSIVWFNEALEAFDDTAYGTISYSCSPNLEHGTDGNITNNPQLVSASHIALTSPCAGSGIIPLDTLDIDGQNWRSTPAIGCDEPADPPTGDLSITIDGPYDVPAGFKTFFTVDIQGELSGDYIDFGDGLTGIHGGIRSFGHTWSTTGTYDLVVTAYNDDYPAGYSVTKTITVFDADFNTIYVRTDGDDNNNGRSWSDAKQTIQAAIDEQGLHGGHVVVSNGVYTLTETISIDKEIQLRSVNGAETTILDGVNLDTHSHIFEIGDNHSIINGFTLRNADNGWTGGAVYCDYTHSPLVSNCILADNHAGTAAGGMCYGTAVDCVFSNNTSTTGAGLYWGQATRCEFIENTASGSGGGMYAGTADDCTFVENRANNSISYANGAGMSKGTAHNCTFIRNESDGYGGGITEGSATDCLFFENTANYGGGMYKGSATDCRFFRNTVAKDGGAINNAIATRCVVSGNQAEKGGGLHSGEAYSCSINGNKAYGDGGGTHSTKLFNCTVTGNSAIDAGGVYGQTKNCIVWGNTATDGMNDINDGNTSLNYIVNTCSPDAVHGVNGSITNNPLLISASTLSAASPCIGKGDAAYATGTDLNGDAWAAIPAMGCDEVSAALTGPINMSLIGPSPIRVYTEGNYIALFEGQVSQTIIDFGDGTPVTNAVGSIPYSWTDSTSRSIDVILTGFNDTYPQGIAFTQVVEVVSSADSDIHVKYAGSNTNDGMSWATAKATIQAGVDAQNIYGGRVLVDAARYAIAETIQVDKPILLTSGSDGIVGSLTSPVIDGGGSIRCFNLGYSECVLEYLVIRNGAATASGDNTGGGIYCANGAPRITYSTIEDCVAYTGAGAYKGTLENCSLSNNAATSYGGATYESSLSQSTISSNSAKYGGGVYGGLLDDCTLSNNTATTLGGGAHSSTVNFSTVTDNTAPSGGGLAWCTADRCDILFNYATEEHGGGMHKGTAHNCTIHNNAAIQDGGGTYSTTLYNCTVAENGAENGGGSYGGSIYNTIVWSNVAFIVENEADIASASPRNSCYPEADHGGYYRNITNAPLFVALAPDILIRGGDYYLSNLSPCINAGDNAKVSTERDYNGLYRIRYGTVDIGACEMWLSGDSDGDEMADVWELENFGGVTNAVGSADADADVFDNYSEYIAGTDPNDGTSYLRITHYDSEPNKLTLYWDSIEGRTYGISACTNLLDGFETVPFDMPYPQDSIELDRPTNNILPAVFYKINVRKND